MKCDDGFVYFISSDDGRFVKIGMTTGESPDSRVSSLQTGCPTELRLEASIKCIGVDPRIVERDAHRAFSAYKVRGEWFEVAGSLAWFLSEMQAGYRYSFAGKSTQSGNRWGFIPVDDSGQPLSYLSISTVGTKSGGCPFGTALYAYKQTNDPLIAENAALRRILAELMEDNAALHACVMAMKSASAAVDRLTDGRFKHSDEFNNASIGAARSIARSSDSVSSNLRYAFSIMSDADEFFGNSLYHCDTPKD